MDIKKQLDNYKNGRISPKELHDQLVNVCNYMEQIENEKKEKFPPILYLRILDLCKTLHDIFADDCCDQAEECDKEVQ